MMKIFKGVFRVFPFFLIVVSIGFIGAFPAFSGDQKEVGKYVRARIALGEAMQDYFSRGGAPRFGPGEGGPSMEELRKMEDEINEMVAKILDKHGLTTEDYQNRSPDVFADNEAVNRFLEAHPELKEKYESLPQSPSRGRR